MVANRVGCVFFFGMPIKTLGSLGKIRVGRVTGNTHIFFFGLRMYIDLVCANDLGYLQDESQD